MVPEVMLQLEYKRGQKRCSDSSMTNCSVSCVSNCGSLKTNRTDTEGTADLTRSVV